jgi:CBS-domain-containing membrane protein
MSRARAAGYGAPMNDTPRSASGAGALVAPTSTRDADGLTVADVMHAEVGSLPPSVTVGELRDWFAVSASRRLAVIADGGRYAGSLTPADVGSDVPAGRPALELAPARPALAPGMPAAAGRDLVVAADGRRLPVVDDDGRLHGVLAVTTDLQFFACRPAPAGG